MKILDILTEAKFTPRIYGYHVTPIENIQSILKHGLIPNKNDGGYGSEDYADAGYTLTPLNGVYFSRTRKSTAAVITGMDFDKVAVIVCKLQPKTFTMDEDRLTADIIEEKNINKLIYDIIKKDGSENITSEYLKHLAIEYSQTIIKRFLSDLDTRLIAYVYNDIVNYVHMIMMYIVDNHDYFGNTDESEIKTMQSILSKKLKKLSSDTYKLSTNNSFKIDDVIGFSGANKIVGIYDVSNNIGWGDLGDYSSKKVKLIDNPLRLVDINAY